VNTEPKQATEPSVPNLERVLANMELRALKVAYPDERARIFNLAGDLCFDAGIRERSLIYYGRAIDVYLDSDLVDAAVAVCCKIVRLTPEVVRARCTLAWLALGRGLFEEAKQRIADYATAASTAGQERFAAKHLRLMTDMSENQEILESLAEALLGLGDERGADRAFGAALGHPSPTPDIPQDSEQRWALVVSMLRGDGPAPVEPALAELRREQAVSAAPLRESTRESLRRRIRRKIARP
jgi:hypothetical protein